MNKLEKQEIEEKIRKVDGAMTQEGMPLTKKIKEKLYNCITGVPYTQEVTKLLFKWLNRRSQKKSYDNIGFNQMLKIFDLPKPKIKVNIYAI